MFRPEGSKRKASALLQGGCSSTDSSSNSSSPAHSRPEPSSLSPTSLFKKAGEGIYKMFKNPYRIEDWNLYDTMVRNVFSLSSDAPYHMVLSPALSCVWSSCIVFSALISIKYYFVLLSPPRLLRRKWKLLFSSHLPTFILDLPIHEWYALHSQSVDFITDLTVLGLSRLGAPPVCVWLLSEPRAQCSVQARSDGS